MAAAVILSSSRAACASVRWAFKGTPIGLPSNSTDNGAASHRQKFVANRWHCAAAQCSVVSCLSASAIICSGVAHAAFADLKVGRVDVLPHQAIHAVGKTRIAERNVGCGPVALMPTPDVA